MQINFQTYIPGESPVHRLDARVKVVLVLTFSVALFFVGSWLGMLAATALYLSVHAASGISASRVLGLVKPVYVLAALVVLCNSFLLTGESVSLQFTLEGFGRGVFFAVRIALLVFASILMSFTTAATDLTNAIAWFLAPLRKVGVFIDDAVMVFSIALRFVPITAEEFLRVRNAQWARGGSFDTGPLIGRVKAWASVLAPVIIGMFRRADSLSLAMDARCYGAADERGVLDDPRVTVASSVVLVAGVALCVLLAWFL